MKKFNVVVEETVVGNFVVEAENAEDALELARRNYREGTFVLEPGEVQDLNFLVADSSEEFSA